jgi:hypothetical protein
MTARLLQRVEARSEYRRRATTTMHPELPIEQSLRAADPAVQTELMQEIWHGQPSREEGALLVADPKCLRVLARSEGALRPPVDALLRRFGSALVVEPPTVRYLHGAPVLEPYMMLLLCGPAHHLQPLQRDLAKRRCEIRRLDHHSGLFVLEAEAPLADLLGYNAWLAGRTEGSTDVSMWLSRYVPIGADGPYAA